MDKKNSYHFPPLQVLSPARIRSVNVVGDNTNNGVERQSLDQLADKTK